MSDTIRSEQIQSQQVIGLPVRTVWRITAVLWAACGLLQIASYALVLTPLRLPLICVIIGGVVPLFLAGLWWEFGRREMRLEPWFHVQILLAFAAMMITSVLDVNDHSADAVYPMLPMVVAVIVFPPWRSFPYVLLGAGSAGATVMIGQDPDQQRRAIVIALIALTIGGIVMSVHNRVRRGLERNRELSETDELTGVANTRRLRQRLAAEFSRELRDGDFRLALLAIDLDDFKGVNDRYGHSTGDMVLIDTAHAIESHIEPSDLVARRGGDEFSLLVLDRPERPAAEVVEHVREAIARRRAVLCPDITPSASVGVVYRELGEGVERFFERADDELHERKREWYALRDMGADGTAPQALREPHLTAVTGGESRTAKPRDLAARREDSRVEPHDVTIRRAAWRILAVFLFALGAIVPLLAAVGHGEGLMTPPVVTICYLTVIGSGVCIFMSTRETAYWQIDAALAATVIATAALIAVAPEARNSLAELMMGPALIAAYAAVRRAAIAYVIVCLSAYTYFLTTLPNENLVIRGIQTSLVVVLLVWMITRGLERARAVSEENERLSGVDPLTGLANLRRLRSRLEDELARCETVGGHVTLFALDLDNFKEVNDRYGHTTGDRVLVAVAEALEREIRLYDMAARRSGDEFMAVVPHASEIDLEGIASRLGEAVAAARMAVCPDVTPSASVGFVTSFAGEEAANLIARADASELMVKLQHRGRRRLHAVA